MKIDEFHKLASDATRLKIMILLRLKERALCVCELTAALALSQAKVSRHLAILRENNVVTSHKKGKWVFYQINHNLDVWAIEILDSHIVYHRLFIDSELRRLAKFNKESNV